MQRQIMIEKTGGIVLAIDYENNWYQSYKPNYVEFDTGLPGFWKMKYEDRWQIITALLGQDFFATIDVLDIGCGMGRALSYYQQYGANVYGVEPSVYASEIAKSRGIEVTNDYFNNIELDREFDVVHIEQVLSHEPKYEEFMVKAVKLLKPDGLLVIEEPNDNNVLQEILKPTKGEYWVTTDHANYFNFNSMKRLLTSNGLEVVKTSATWPMELFELSGDCYLGDEAKGKEVHLKRYNLESKLPFTVRQNIHESFAKLGIGRDLVMFCKEKGGLK